MNGRFQVRVSLHTGTTYLCKKLAMVITVITIVIIVIVFILIVVINVLAIVIVVITVTIIIAVRNPVVYTRSHTSRRLHFI